MKVLLAINLTILAASGLLLAFAVRLMLDDRDMRRAVRPSVRRHDHARAVADRSGRS